MSEDFLWVEKYRPRKIADTILPAKLKAAFQAIVDSGEIPNMILSGTAGLGKTTVARALCNELDLDYLIINASLTNIDTLRNKIHQFASTISMAGGYKVVILDEADYLNPNSFQPALRGFMEEFSKNCRFILTCNFKNRLIEPLHSRGPVYEFNTTRKEMAGLAAQFMKRVEYILKTEGVSYDEKTVADLIIKHAPDWRRVLGELQRSALTGEITPGTVSIGSSKFRDLFESLKAKDFKKMRQWVVNNMDTDSSSIFRGLYDEMNNHIKPQSTPQLILILAEYQYKAAFVADQEINTVACMTEVMSNVEFL
jgi:DNA polymerase III delta prime subunit